MDSHGHGGGGTGNYEGISWLWFPHWDIGHQEDWDKTKPFVYLHGLPKNFTQGSSNLRCDIKPVVAYCNPSTRKNFPQLYGEYHCDPQLHRKTSCQINSRKGTSTGWLPWGLTFHACGLWVSSTSAFLKHTRRGVEGICSKGRNICSAWENSWSLYLQKEAGCLDPLLKGSLGSIPPNETLHTPVTDDPVALQFQGWA